MKYLVDTNVICELRKKRPNLKVEEWIKEINPNNVYISCLTIGEIQEGIIRKAKYDAHEAKILTKWLELILEEYSERIIDVDTETCLKWSELLVIDKTNAVDALMAAQAIYHGMTVVTRNVKHFIQFKVKLLNPFMDNKEN
jgi:predicted nucleic acid-binding protein